METNCQPTSRLECRVDFLPEIADQATTDREETYTPRVLMIGFLQAFSVLAQFSYTRYV
jgi:hypothetical protein